MLVLCTVIWGGTFPAVKFALGYAPPWTIVVLRFTAAALIFALLLRSGRNSFSRVFFGQAAVLGICFFAGFGLQTIGLQYTTTSRSAFLTQGMVFFVPVLAYVISRRRPTLFTLTGAGIVAVGLYALTSPAGILDWNRGDWLTLAGAFAFSGYIIGVDRWSTKTNRLHLAFLQSVVVAVLAFPLALGEGAALPARAEFMWAMAFLILMGTVVVIYLQMRYQPMVSPARASIIFALEPVFAMVYAAVLGLEQLSMRAIGGAVLVTLGVIWSEVGATLLVRRKAPMV